MKSIALISALALASLAGTVRAEETIEPPTCVKPAIPESSFGNESAIKSKRKDNSAAEFQKLFDDYRACMKTYVDSHGELAKKHIAAANAAVQEVNEYIQQVNASH